MPSDAQLERLKHRSKLSQLSVSCPPPPSELYECVIVSSLCLSSLWETLGCGRWVWWHALKLQQISDSCLKLHEFRYFFYFFWSICTLCMNAALHTRKLSAMSWSFEGKCGSPSQLGGGETGSGTLEWFASGLEVVNSVKNLIVEKKKTLTVTTTQQIRRIVRS